MPIVFEAAGRASLFVLMCWADAPKQKTNLQRYR